MLTAEQTAGLRWHPLRDIGRVDNYALEVLGRAKGYMPKHPTRVDPGMGLYSGALYYQMACGHRSLPGHAICERGCLSAPNYDVQLRRTGWGWQRGLKEVHAPIAPA